MERDPDNSQINHGNKHHNDSLQEESKITAGHSTAHNSQAKGPNDNSRMMMNERSQFMLENSLGEEGHNADTMGTEISKILPQGGVDAANSMFLPNEASRDLLMDDSAMHSIQSPKGKSNAAPSKRNGQISSASNNQNGISQLEQSFDISLNQKPSQNRLKAGDGAKRKPRR